MEKISPINQLRSRLETQAEIELQHKQAQEREETGHALATFHIVFENFMEYLHENSYPFATISTFRGNEFVSIRLYETKVVDGDLFFEGSPLSILIDEQGNNSFVYETIPEYAGSDYYKKNRWDTYPPQSYEMPRSIDEYPEALSRQSGNWNHYPNATSLLGWSAHMVHQMNQFAAHGHDKMYASPLYMSQKRTIISKLQESWTK